MRHIFYNPHRDIWLGAVLNQQRDSPNRLNDVELRQIVLLAARGFEIVSKK
jgi:hypothetical protein